MLSTFENLQFMLILTRPNSYVTILTPTIVNKCQDRLKYSYRQLIAQQGVIVSNNSSIEDVVFNSNKRYDQTLPLYKFKSSTCAVAILLLVLSTLVSVTLAVVTTD
jgi:hypothetical protein